MIRAALALGALAACAPIERPAPASPTAEPIIQQEQIETQSDGRCYAFDPGPDRFTTVTQQVMIVPEVRDDAGKVTQPAVFRNEDRRVRVPPETVTRFEVVCPQSLSQSFVASLQRALSARGAYQGQINGRLDQTTQSAIRAFQTTSGRHSAILAVKTAQSLGLIAVQ